MVIALILHVFTVRGHRWTIGGKRVTVTESHIKGALDEAARILYDKDVGTTVTVGGLHIEKTKTGQDVYVHVGEYQ